MVLTAGSRLGPYDILSALGTGGFGEVYKARDTRLDRAVAIKILPSADPELKARFEREAKAIAALQHPHICTLYDVGHREGTDYLVMEFLEGETLADRLTRGPLKIDEALKTAIDIADALDAAHRAGFLHRDLKPANVMLTKSGAKLLDFGLAKLRPQPPVSGLSMAPTQNARPLTSQGSLLGTLHYMAPEQVEGKEADARSDIFAFGALVYEMVTGKRAFDGKSQASVIAAVLSGEPAPMSALQPVVPDELDRIVRTCLAKEPEDRWQSAADVARQLGWMVDGRSGVGSLVPVGAHRRQTRRLAAAAASSVLGALVAGGAVWVATRPVPPEPQRVSVLMPADHPVAFGWAPGLSLAISPDGTTLVYVARDPAGSPSPIRATHLQVRSLADRTARSLPKTEGAAQPFFSPDGQWVAFFTERELKKISLSGGNPVTLLDKIDGGQWGFGAWTDEGTIIFSTAAGPAAGGLQRIAADGGSPQNVTPLKSSDGEVAHLSPALVDGTRAVLFTVLTGQLRDPRIDAVRLDTGERRVILDNATGAHYLKTGHLLFRRGDGLLVAPFDPKRLTITGPVVPLADDVRGDGAASDGPISQLAVSRSGTLAYVPADDAKQTLGRVSRDGGFEPTGPTPNRFDSPRVSPTGQYIAFEISHGQQAEVHVHDVVRGTTTKLTQEGSDRWPVWRPDGTALAVWSRKRNAFGIYLRDLSGAERLLLAGEVSGGLLRPGSWSPDGKALAYTVQSGSSHDIWILTLDSQPTARPLLNSPASEHSPRFSPDGRWLAYVSEESGRPEVYVRRYPDGDKLPVSTGGGVGPVWSRDGREIFFQGAYEGAPRLMRVLVTPDGGTVKLGTPTRVLDMRVPTLSGTIEQYATSANWGPRYDIFPDGKQFLMIKGADAQGTREIVLVQHWFEEVKRLVSTTR